MNSRFSLMSERYFILHGGKYHRVSDSVADRILLLVLHHQSDRNELTTLRHHIQAAVHRGDICALARLVHNAIVEEGYSFLVDSPKDPLLFNVGQDVFLAYLATDDCLVPNCGFCDSLALLGTESSPLPASSMTKGHSTIIPSFLSSSPRSSFCNEPAYLEQCNMKFQESMHESSGTATNVPLATDRAGAFYPSASIIQKYQALQACITRASENTDSSASKA